VCNNVTRGQICERIRAQKLCSVGEVKSATKAGTGCGACLPLVFVLAGSGLGGDPVAFLIATTPGLACLSAGLALSYAGLEWLQRIADAVLRG